MGGLVSLPIGSLGYPWAQASYPVQDSALQYLGSVGSYMDTIHELRYM